MAGRGSEEKPREMVAYCFSDSPSSGNQNIQTHLIGHHLQSFQHTPEMYNLSDMVGFPTKNLHQQEGEAPHSGEFYQHNETLMESSSSAWNPNHHHNRLMIVDDDPSLRCVFTCEGNERPSQGLSLSLSSSNPSSIGLQPFELRQQPQPQGYSHVNNSKFLGPAQQLLNEFCNLGPNQNDDIPKMKPPHNHKDHQTDAKNQAVYSLDLVELQRRKTKLLLMLEEVDRRYKHYCDQMKSVTSSFEAVAGEGAAAVYSVLASKAMSRHFRSLRDGIVREIKATKKGMGEKEVSAPGSVKGETPRLRVLDQTLRQQKALQQMSMMENHPWRPQRGLPERSVSLLRAWLFEHFLHPYPSDVDKHILARQTGLSRSQVSNWFINARVRLWKPMVEEMYLEEQKENEGVRLRNEEDQKPTHDQLARLDSECLSSIINNQDKKSGKTLQHDHNPTSSHYGAMELDFSSYTAAPRHSSVSLTLGLGEGGGVSLAFSTPSHSQQTSLFYPRDQMEDCQTVQYPSLLESDNQSLQYRNLMGAQLLHDLAG